MLTVPEALDAIRSHARRLPPRPVPLHDALGLRLAFDVVADLDLPPFDKAVVDGFAVRSADLAEAESVSLQIVETVYAGQSPTRAVGPGEATEIMTGAPLPEGADAVVMVEKTLRPFNKERVIVAGPIAAGQNRLVRGKEMRAGEVVVEAGSVINPARVGVIASVGGGVTVWPRPGVTVMATGDEVVDYSTVPGPGQIRNSNTPLLAALARQWGADAGLWPIVPDDADRLKGNFQVLVSHLICDILLVCGGVSAGQKDLVPAALEAVGVTPVFHKVRVKPGKPLWFGVGPDRGDRPPALVFGLPGNPVSGLVSFLLFVRPALAILTGDEPEPPQTLPLAAAYRHADERDVYRPARLMDGGTRVEPLLWSGSSDLRRAASGDGFAIFPAGERMYEQGEPVGFLPMAPGGREAHCRIDKTWHGL